MDQPGGVVYQVDMRNKLVESNEGRGQTADVKPKQRMWIVDGFAGSILVFVTILSLSN